ncbi:hypothetical protein L6452_08011 [Arctium lappa]|uniref:Uncharacterized protein n=1 Tax=Arctium lappa TaxID=4217 RepID=A0ACB9DGJ7_ARCLA|nr:hypothetical protein L6452_08011 [Arctium lappa]
MIIKLKKRETRSITFIPLSLSQKKKFNFCFYFAFQTLLKIPQFLITSFNLTSIFFLMINCYLKHFTFHLPLLFKDLNPQEIATFLATLLVDLIFWIDLWVQIKNLESKR